MARKPRGLTKEQLAQEADSQLRGNAKETLDNFWVAVNAGLKRGDKHCIELVARAFQYDKGPGGVTIFNQHLQVNGAAAGGDAVQRVRSFDQIIGKLEDQDALRRNRLLEAAPLENSEPNPIDDNILDADTEDIPEFPAMPDGE